MRILLLSLVYTYLSTCLASQEGECSESCEMVERKVIHFVSHPSSGHLNGIRWAAVELARRGNHLVRFTSYDNTFEKMSKEKVCGGVSPCYYEFISAGPKPFTNEEESEIFKVCFDPRTPPPILFDQIGYYWSTYERDMYKKMLPYFEENIPDLMVAEATTNGATDIAEKLNISFMLLSSWSLGMTLAHSHFEHYGFENYPWLPLQTMPIQESVTKAWNVPSRLFRFFVRPLIFKIPGFWVVHYRNEFRKEVDLPPVSSLLPTEYGNPLLLIAEARGLSPARPLPPHVHLIGPQLDPEIVKIANEGLDNNSKYNLLPEIQFLDRESIVVSFGSVKVLSKEEVTKLYDLLAFLPKKYHILWILRDKQSEHLKNVDIEDNIKIMNWVNQPAVLASRNVKLFVTHCGMNSFNEAQTFRVPILSMPQGGDQPINAMLAADIGMGLTLPLLEATRSSFLEAVETIIHTPSFKKAAIRAGKISAFHGGPSYAADWIEFRADIGETDFLVPQSYAAPFWIRWNLDILMALTMIAFLIRFFVSSLMRCICCSCSSN